MENHETPHEVRVYGLANPADLKQEEAAITRVLYQTLRVSDPARHRVHVSASSGWIEYVDAQEMWREGPTRRLPDAAGARNRAEEFLQALVRAFSRAETQGLTERLATMVLVPLLKPVQIALIARPDGSGWDHWLYRAQPQLVLGRTDRRTIDVLGSEMEVRIGEGGRVINYHARWRPVTAERITSDLVPFSAESLGHHGGGQLHQESQYRLVYPLEGDGIPQYYLSPYYLVDEGHIFSLASACAYSLTVGFDVKQRDEENTSITAVVMGGSGQYAFNWAVYALDDVWDHGIRELGAGAAGQLHTEDGERIDVSTVTVQSGAYVVLVNVKDRRTGAFKHHQQHVYSFPTLEEGPPERALVS